MAPTCLAKDVLDRDFLETRHRLLGVAAALDRIDRAVDAESIQQDPRMAQIRKAARILVDDKPDRAQRLQMAFSLPYDDGWRA